MKKLLAVFLLTLVTTASALETDNDHSDQAQSKQESTAQSKLSQSDELLIAVQRFCPVTGKELGTMGEPVKVKVGNQVAFLCCRSCESKKIDAQHWTTIQQRIAQAQAVCPIMEKPVDASMKSTVVNGQKVFVCCPPCIAKIEADAETTLKKVTSNYKAFVTAERQTESDRLQAIAQSICPVSGKKLGPLDELTKVKVGEKETAFLCCTDCVGKKIDPNHWKTIQNNLAKIQETCPVMNKPIDASMKAAFVNGRKIFVCCPPCIKKIEADPQAFIAGLNKKIAQAAAKKSRVETRK